MRTAHYWLLHGMTLKPDRRTLQRNGKVGRGYGNQYSAKNKDVASSWGSRVWGTSYISY